MDKPGLAKVETGGLIYLRMSKPLKAITIIDDTESNTEQEKELQQQPMD